MPPLHPNNPNTNPVWGIITTITTMPLQLITWGSLLSLKCKCRPLFQLPLAQL